MGRDGSKYARGMYSIAEQWPFLRYLGLGAWWAWIWSCYNSTALFSVWPAGDIVGHVGLMYLCSTPAIALALIASALLWRRATPLLARRGLVVGIAMLAFVGVLLVAYSPWMGGDAVFAVGGVLTGLGTSVLCLKTGETYGTLGRHEVLTVGCFSLVVAAFLYFMTIGLPSAWQPVFVAALPMVSAALFVMPADDPFPADVSTMRDMGMAAPGARSFMNLVLASVMIAGTAGFGKGLAALSMLGEDFAAAGAVMTFVIACAALVICVVVNSGDIVKSVRRVYTALILLGVTVAMLSLLGLNLVYMNVGKELLWMMFTCLMAYTAFRFGYSPVRMFGFGQAAYLVSSAVFWLVGMRAAPALDGQTGHVVAVVAMVFAIVAVFAFVFTDADIKFLLTWGREAQPPSRADDPARPTAEGGWAPSDAAAAFAENGPWAEGAAASGTGAPGIGGRLGGDEPAGSVPAGDVPGGDAPDGKAPSVAASAGPSQVLPSDVARRYGLSDRELEVLTLFAQGRSANWIAEALTISNNTVRSHLRSSYVKLDVHTRQELIDFVAAHRG